MDNLTIRKTKYTMGVSFDAASGLLNMEGSSYPENAIEFFRPIQDWIAAYLKEQRATVTLTLKLEYLNTSSSKCILDLFSALEQFQESSGNVKVRWYYETDDEDMLEIGEDFSQDLNLPFEFIAF